jgi:hypothetical protein
MICYKDMTFCSFYQECKKGGQCNRAETPDVIYNAKASNLLICEFIEKPSCFRKKKKRIE